jgi:hypothetical protein
VQTPLSLVFRLIKNNYRNTFSRYLQDHWVKRHKDQITKKFLGAYQMTIENFLRSNINIFILAGEIVVLIEKKKSHRGKL